MNKIVSSVLAVALPWCAGCVRAGSVDDVKAAFDRFVAAQNAHDLPAVRELLRDSPDFLRVTRGTPTWGRDAALERFATLYKGTWRLAPETAKLRVVMLSATSAQPFVPILFNVGAPGQSAPDAPFLMNRTLVKTPHGWKIAGILPIPLPAPSPSTPSE